MIIIYSCHWFFLGAIAIVFLRQQQAFAVLIWTGIAGNVFLISLDAYHDRFFLVFHSYY